MRDDRVTLAALAAFMLTMMVLGVLYAHGADRCQDYTTDVRIQHIRYLGSDYPYWYGVGQIRQESGCRPDATAFDGGQGLSQFMPATERDVEKALGELDMYNPNHALRAQAYYMSRLHKQNIDGRLFLDYQAYNGGWTNLKREIHRAGVVDWYVMRECCKRKVIALKNGRYLNLCDVNYDYSKKIFQYSQQYRVSYDRRAYW